MVFAFFLKSPEKLPASYPEKMLHEPLHRVVCDYIAGMTDNYAQDQHRVIREPFQEYLNEFVAPPAPAR